MTREMIAFLPCRAGSQRVPKKNTRRFAGIEGGLLAIKLEQLSSAACFDQIVVSTNDPEVIEVVEDFSTKNARPIVLDHRPDHLCSSSTSTDEVIAYAAHLFDDVDLFWTHVTSPFVTAEQYNSMASQYLQVIEDGTYDSVVSANVLRTFLWNKDGPVNYDRTIERWPRTQTLDPVYEINSAAFIIATSHMREYGDRIGARPFFYELPYESAFDIDWENDFTKAEALYGLELKKSAMTI
jgi:CMP-N-acetylneuraminic acid synthetase